MDNTYTIETGGINKTFHQLSGMPNPIHNKEALAKGSGEILLTWTPGFLKDKNNNRKAW